MVTINWTFEALEDLDRIVTYIEGYSPAFSVLLVKKVFESTDKLMAFPKMGRVVPEFELERIREVIYKNYRIVYHILDAKHIDIITIQHSSSPLNRTF